MNNTNEIKVLIELNSIEENQVTLLLKNLSSNGFINEDKFKPITLKPKKLKGNLESKTDQILNINNVSSLLIKGVIKKELIKEIEKLDGVKKVWMDTPVAHFACGFTPCDCNTSVSKGNIARVAECLGVNEIWMKGFKGKGIVIGIVDGGVDKNEIPAVIGGHLPDFGTQANWGKHGNMTATDALGMAPDSKIYDLRIADDSADVATNISNAIAAYDWAIEQHKKDGTPHVLSNSWGIYQESWDADYATNPGHPFTRKVEEAIEEGILVLFAAGNCGEGCADSRCKSDKGPGRSIWGANGHPDVMTVGAATICGDLIGYSSQGDAALSNDKPDFCSISHFKGYFPVDTGTSASCPIAAGIVAVLKQSDPSLTQDEIKNSIRNSALDIGTTGWDIHSGSGIIQPIEAFNKLHPTDTINPSNPNKECKSKAKIEKECIAWETRQHLTCVRDRETRVKVCDEERDEGYQRCDKEEDKGYSACDDWVWWLGWLCVAWVWISHIVCVVWTWVVNIVCVVWHWIVFIFCVAWVWISARFCSMYAWNKPCCCYEHLKK